jgi:flagellar motor switch protein FliM
MTDVLTPEQIAELVAAAKDGEVPAKPAAPTRRPRRVREIDFTRPVKLAPDQQRRFERAHETFCRTASTRLSAELRTPFEMEVINVEQLTWSTALSGIPQPSIFGVATTQPAETTILVCVEQPCVFNVLERLIGGGDSETVPSRTLTEIEMALTRRTFAGIVEQLSNVWQELFGLQLSLVELESQVANVELAPPSEPTVAMTIETRGGRMSSTMSLLVPHRSIAAVTGRLSSHYADHDDSPAADDALEELVRTSIGAVEVDIRAEVGAIEMTIGEVLALGEGDVLRLGGSASNGVFVCADGVRLHRARPGRNGSRRAVEIVERIEEQA